MLNVCTRLDSVMGVSNAESYNCDTLPRYQYGRWNMKVQQE